MDKNFYYQVQDKPIPKTCTFLRFAASDTYSDTASDIYIYLFMNLKVTYH